MIIGMNPNTQYINTQEMDSINQKAKRENGDEEET